MSSIIVPKTWGEEVWYVNRDYCGKRLIFAEDHRCSVHYHKNKHETFLIEDGTILLELYKAAYTRIDVYSHFYPVSAILLKQGQSIEIPPGLGHRMTAVGGNAAIIEFSSHHEDSDSYRIETGQLWE
jgi:mannose-6-phosphate isomerase-like protein (cupin superfamily)